MDHVWLGRIHWLGIVRSLLKQSGQLMRQRVNDIESLLQNLNIYLRTFNLLLVNWHRRIL